jgi:hypothetical protein
VQLRLFLQSNNQNSAGYLEEAVDNYRWLIDVLRRKSISPSPPEPWMEVSYVGVKTDPENGKRNSL